MLKRNCDNCKQEYKVDNRNLKRGWGLTCSKSCAAKMREKKSTHVAPAVHFSSGKISGYTDEGYIIMDNVAYDEFDEPMYEIN